MFNYTKLLFLTMIILGSLLTMSATNWMSMWMGLELNLMAFIPFIYKKKAKKISQAMMIYFLVQSMSTMIILFSILMNKMMYMESFNLTSHLVTMGILIKLGVAPFHNWFIEMISSINWMENFVLMTWQKVAPMIFISNFMINKNMMLISIILSSTIGAIGGLNTSSLRKILAFSSINHMSWMMMMLLMQAQWYLYLLIYTIILFTATQYFNSNKTFYINQVNMKFQSIISNYTFAFIMLSMGGLPPFLGFLPKWMVINCMINSNMIMIMMIMIMMSLITLFYYMRVISSLMLIHSSLQSWNYTKSKNYIMSLFINLMLPLFLILSFI